VHPLMRGRCLPDRLQSRPELPGRVRVSGLRVVSRNRGRFRDDGSFPGYPMSSERIGAGIPSRSINRQNSAEGIVALRGAEELAMLFEPMVAGVVPVRPRGSLRFAEQEITAQSAHSPRSSPAGDLRQSVE
jgi:hypothetical protein